MQLNTLWYGMVYSEIPYYSIGYSPVAHTGHLYSSVGTRVPGAGGVVASCTLLVCCVIVWYGKMFVKSIFMVC